MFSESSTIFSPKTMFMSSIPTKHIQGGTDRNHEFKVFRYIDITNIRDDKRKWSFEHGAAEINLHAPLESQGMLVECCRLLSALPGPLPWSVFVMHLSPHTLLRWNPPFSCSPHRKDPSSSYLQPQMYRPASTALPAVSRSNFRTIRSLEHTTRDASSS